MDRMPTDDVDLTLEPMDEPTPPSGRQPTLPLPAPTLDFGRLPGAAPKRSPRAKPTTTAPVDEGRLPVARVTGRVGAPGLLAGCRRLRTRVCRHR